MTQRKICIVSGSRAEYGLLYWLMKAVKDDAELELQIVVTGMHLSPEFGLTFHEIEKDGFLINRKVEMLISGDNSSSITKSVGIAMIGFADTFTELNPDIIVILGDRFEIMAVALAATFARIPIGHISGGETTLGAFDESIRHSVTKMAWWHFTAAVAYRERVIQLGEHPNRVFITGGLGVDCVVKSHLLSKEALSKAIQFEFGLRNLLVTYHPATLELASSGQQFQSLLEALDLLEGTHFIFTTPNADTDGRVIQRMIEDFVAQKKGKAKSFKSLGSLNYLSALKFVDAVVGNSSSGLGEAPSLKIGTINIGDRQLGRLKAKSVIDCDANVASITQAISKLYGQDFQDMLKTVHNPNGDGDATEKIMDILKNHPIPTELKKEFYDL